MRLRSVFQGLLLLGRGRLRAGRPQLLDVDLLLLLWL